ncbi:hypothetical protein CERSUDRAFT_118042 [Gelatoporia subvermispora B]|uniref:Uncharacterized protein n=1 Tax=Ceriporiopsis subvermispora (strain B) TaxID=914234 RepID=M2Q9D8_CERS8|nr:hypothetical protein CERSUDRAFT_118042 [Gelatoporia subvermispora B]
MSECDDGPLARRVAIRSILDAYSVYGDRPDPQVLYFFLNTMYQMDVVSGIFVGSADFSNLPAEEQLVEEGASEVGPVDMDVEDDFQTTMAEDLEDDVEFQDGQVMPGLPVLELIARYMAEFDVEVSEMQAYEVPKDKQPIDDFLVLDAFLKVYIIHIERRINIYACFWTLQEIKRVVYWLSVFYCQHRLLASNPPQSIMNPQEMGKLLEDCVTCVHQFEREILPALAQDFDHVVTDEEEDINID